MSIDNSGHDDVVTSLDKVGSLDLSKVAVALDNIVNLDDLSTGLVDDDRARGGGRGGRAQDLVGGNDETGRSGHCGCDVRLLK